MTYTGAAFDLQVVALQGVRLAVGTLLANSHPDEDHAWNVGVVHLRDAAGRRTEPRWTVYELRRDPECPVCTTLT